ncbi:MAG: dipeptide epimerase [Bacteroidota bacterium]
MNLHLHSFNLPLWHTFAISRRSFDHQQTFIVELEQDGVSGYGEATVNPYYPNTEVAHMQSVLESLRPQIEAASADDPRDCWDRWRPSLQDCPFAHCALDVALWDLHGKLRQKPLYQIWNTSHDGQPSSCYTLSIASPDTLVKRMQERPWPLYKIKLGTEDDIGLVRHLRQHSQARFCVDANAAWTAEETIANAKALKSLGVEFIEQPLAANDWEGMQQVFQASVLPLVADESCRSLADVSRCAQCFHGINIKLMKCGGLTPALRMIQQAKSHNLMVMVGCMTESTIGISAIAQLLPQLDFVDMDGPLFLREDLATGVRITPEGNFLPPGKYGTCVEVNW